MRISTGKVTDLSTTIPKEWMVSDILVKASGLKVEHHMQSASEIAIEGSSRHVLCITLSTESTRQITRIGKKEYDGENMPKSFWLLGAESSPASWSWDGLDETILFSVEPSYFQSIARECDYAASQMPIVENVAFGTDAKIEWFARQFKAEMQQKGSGSWLYCESLGMLYVLHLLRNYTCQEPSLRQSANGLGNQRLKRVIDYIEEYLTNSIGLEELANVAGLSKCHFSVMFKLALGVPPYRYLLLRRTERAKQHLRQGDLPISDIALACGFADQSHLTKHFRKVVGITPRAYREG